MIPGTPSFAMPALGVLLAALTASAGAMPAAAQSSCKEFAEVRTAIDTVIDRDPVKGAHFRKEFKEGADSIHILEGLVDEEMKKLIYICRFDVAEYLTKRGFPPPH